MDQILKWAIGIVFCFVAAHFVIEFVVSNTENQANVPQQNIVELDARATVTPEPENVAEIEDPLPGRAVRIAQGRNGHFFLDAKVNGATIPFVVDTGASYVALNYDDARRAGIHLKKSDFKYKSRTANGIAHFAKAKLKTIRYKGIRLRDVQAFVAQRGALSGQNLLGNSFLNQLREFKIKDGNLIMIP